MVSKHFARSLIAVGFTALSSACAAPTSEQESTELPVDAPLGTTASAITGGAPASTFMQQRTVMLATPVAGTMLSKTCTGVIIGPSHVLTAAHCLASQDNTTVFFYNSTNLPNAGTRGVVGVFNAPGVHPEQGDVHDLQGNFADFAVLALSAPIPSTSRVADMDLGYPGEDAAAMLVGRGLHNGQANGNFLRFAMNTFYSSSTSSGFFYMNDSVTEKGDSGGPAFGMNGKVEGVLQGADLVGTWRDSYTSSAFHIKFILDAMRYVTKSLVLHDISLSGGTVMSISLVPSARVCEYSCDTNTACHGFTVIGGSLCTLRSTLSNDVVTIQGATSGVR